MNNPSLPPPLSRNINKTDSLNASTNLNNRIRRSPNAASVIIPLMKMTDPRFRKTMTSYNYTPAHNNNSNTTSNQRNKVYKPDNINLRQSQRVSRPQHKIVHVQRVSKPHTNNQKVSLPLSNVQIKFQSHTNNQKVYLPLLNTQIKSQSYTNNQKVHTNSQKMPHLHKNSQRVSQPRTNSQTLSQSHTNNQKLSQQRISNQNASQPRTNSQSLSQSSPNSQKASQPSTSNQKLSQSHTNSQNTSQPRTKSQKLSQPSPNSEKLSQPRTNIQKSVLTPVVPVNSCINKQKQRKPEINQQKLAESSDNAPSDKNTSDNELLGLLKSNSIFKRRHSKKKPVASPLQKVQPKPAQHTTATTQSKKIALEQDSINTVEVNKTATHQINKTTPTQRKTYLPLLVTRKTLTQSKTYLPPVVTRKTPTQSQTYLPLLVTRKTPTQSKTYLPPVVTRKTPTQSQTYLPPVVTRKTPTQSKTYLPLLVTRKTPIHVKMPVPGLAHKTMLNKVNKPLQAKTNKTIPVQTSTSTPNISNKTMAKDSNKATSITHKRLPTLATNRAIEIGTRETTRLLSVQPNEGSSPVSTEPNKSAPISTNSSVATDNNTSTEDTKAVPVKSMSLPFQITNFTLVKLNKPSKISSRKSTPSTIDTRSSSRAYTPKAADAVVNKPKAANAVVNTPKAADAVVDTPKAAISTVNTPQVANTSVDTPINTNTRISSTKDRTAIGGAKVAISSDNESLADLKSRVNDIYDSDNKLNKKLETPTKEPLPELVKLKNLPLYSSGLKSSSNKSAKLTGSQTKGASNSINATHETTPLQRKEALQHQLSSLPSSPKFLLSNSKRKSLTSIPTTSGKILSRESNIINDSPNPHKGNSNTTKQAPPSLIPSKEEISKNTRQKKSTEHESTTSKLQFKSTETPDISISYNDHDTINNKNFESKIKQKSEVKGPNSCLQDNQHTVTTPQQLWPNNKEITSEFLNEDKGGSIFNNTKSKLQSDDSIVQNHLTEKPNKRSHSTDKIEEAEGNDISTNNFKFDDDISHDKPHILQDKGSIPVTKDDNILSNQTEMTSLLASNMKGMNASKLLNMEKIETPKTSATQFSSIILDPPENITASSTDTEEIEPLISDDFKSPKSNDIRTTFQRDIVTSESSLVNTPKAGKGSSTHAVIENQNTSILRRKHTGSFKSSENQSNKKPKPEPTDPDAEGSAQHSLEDLGKNMLDFTPVKIMPMNNSLHTPTHKEKSSNVHQNMLSDDNPLTSSEKRNTHLDKASPTYKNMDNDSQEFANKDNKVENFDGSYITRSVTTLRSQENDGTYSSLRTALIEAPSDVKTETVDEDNLSLASPSTKMEIIYVSDSDRNSDSAVDRLKSERIKDNSNGENAIRANGEELEEESDLDSSSSVDPYEERKKFERNFTIFARGKLKGKGVIEKDLVSTLISSGIAKHLPLNGNPAVSVSNDICSVANFEQLHTIFYQQIHKKDNINYLPIDQIIDKRKLDDQYMLYPEGA